MTRAMSIFSIVFAAAGVANASPGDLASAPQYEGSFQAKGVSNSGVNYDRRFKVSVQFMPRTDILGTAQVDEVTSPEIQGIACKTHVSFELGKVQIQARDTRSGEMVTQTLSWTSTVTDLAKKIEDQPCALSNLEGKVVVGSASYNFPLKSAVHGKATTLYLEIEPALEGALPADFAMASSLQKVSADSYAVLPFAPSQQARVNWLYVHEENGGLTWGSSGGIALKLKN